MARAARRDQTEVVFNGGKLSGERRLVDDTRRSYYGIWKGPKPPGEGANSGPMKDKYEFDAASGQMVYVGTIFGDEDERTMRRMTREEVERWSKLLSVRPRTEAARRRPSRR